MRLPVAGVEREIFVRRIGTGSTVTMLHGFPSSSHDWASVAPPLAERHALLLPDFLGFGASDKPAEHDYTLHEQADLVEALWEREGVNSTAVVAHDYAVSVTQELLARRAEGTLDTDLAAVHLLNGGLYPELHRPEPVETGAAGSRARAADQRRAHGGAVRQGPGAHIRRGIRRRFRQRRHLAGDEPRRRSADRPPPHSLHHRPQAPRRALGRRAGGHRRASRFRVGHARPGIWSTHGATDPRAHTQRPLPRA